MYFLSRNLLGVLLMFCKVIIYPKAIVILMFCRQCQVCNFSVTIRLLHLSHMFGFQAVPELRKAWYAILKFSFMCVASLCQIEELESEIVDSLGMEIK